MPHSDVLVVGAGHNGLVAAILAAQEGRQVTILERGAHPGGATVSETVFSGHPARLSRYSYLISLFPAELAARLGIELSLAPRQVASYTPVRRSGRATGLLVQSRPGPATEASFREVTGSGRDYAAWCRFYGQVAEVASVVAPLLLGPLAPRSAVRDAVVAAAGSEIWDDLMERPLGETIRERFEDDTVRGVVATDGLIGTHTSLFDESLLANRCFLYHVIGRGTGEWQVPIGGMGALTASLLRRVHELGVEIHLDAAVSALAEDASGVDLTVQTPHGERAWRADQVLAAVAPAVVQSWAGIAVRRPVGAQLKVNLLLNRLPTLASGIDPAVAFSGTTHLEEGFEQLEAAYRQSCAGEVPRPLPSEVYCHSLTDSSILGGRTGATLTLFGLHTPVDLFDADPEATRAVALESALAALQLQLAEPLENCLATDAEGRPCIDVATPLDLDAGLGMPGGNIFHGDLSWPWLAESETAESPAQAYGVEIEGHTRVRLAGAGSRRGGGVSGLGGLAAVDSLLQRP